MDKFSELFDKEMVENISHLVEDKMKVLRDIPDFKEKDKKLSNLLEELDEEIPQELHEKFDDAMRLNYHVEEYYFTLAYLLGLKCGNAVKEL